MSVSHKNGTKTLLTGHADISNPLCITEISFPHILARYKQIKLLE